MKVDVYGGYHSPWVQAVLLALHDAGVEHRVRQVPPLEAVRQWGVLMPAVSIDHGPWEVESAQILGKLGWGSISDEDLQAVKTAWQGVLHRPDKPFRFFAAFARAGDNSPSRLTRSMRNFARSFIPMYMFVLINVAKLTMKPVEPENFGDQYMVWEQALERRLQVPLLTEKHRVFEICCCLAWFSAIQAFRRLRFSRFNRMAVCRACAGGLRVCMNAFATIRIFTPAVILNLAWRSLCLNPLCSGQSFMLV